jgi:PTS system nitrogen regulatory IIA component
VGSNPITRFRYFGRFLIGSLGLTACFGSIEIAISNINERGGDDSVKITDFLSERAISVNLSATDKAGVLRELVQLLVKSGEIKPQDESKIVSILEARENLGSTGIGQGVGIPHGKSNVIRRIVGALGISKRGVDFDALDGEPVHIFFLLMAPEDSAGPHLKALARVSRLLKDRYFRESLREAKDEKEVLRIVQQEDQKNV